MAKSWRSWILSSNCSVSKLTSTRDWYFDSVQAIGHFHRSIATNLLKFHYISICQLLHEVRVEGILNLQSAVCVMMRLWHWGHWAFRGTISHSFKRKWTMCVSPLKRVVSLNRAWRVLIQLIGYLRILKASRVLVDTALRIIGEAQQWKVYLTEDWTWELSVWRRQHSGLHRPAPPKVLPSQVWGVDIFHAKGSCCVFL